MTQSQIPGRTQAAVQSMEKIESPTLATFYTNSIDILLSVFDVVITLGQMKAATLEHVVVEQQARIYMSPQHLKVFAKLLTEKVRSYEDSFGTIPEQPTASQPPDEQFPDAAPV